MSFVCVLLLSLLCSFVVLPGLRILYMFYLSSVYSLLICFVFDGAFTFVVVLVLGWVVVVFVFAFVCVVCLCYVLPILISYIWEN